MAGDILIKYPAATTALTVTNLHSLASSQDWTAGWSSASFNNTSNNYKDWLIGAKFTTHASNRQAGFINIYIIAALNDTPTWPASASGTPGTEGALSFTDIEERDSACQLLSSIAVDASASAVMDSMMGGIRRLYGDNVPPYFAIYISQNASTTTTAGLAAAGSAVYATPRADRYT
jgi:hypothetical protein